MESSHDFLDEAEDMLAQPMKWDMEIAEDNLRYSTWFSGLSSAGIAIVLLNYEKLKNLSGLGDLVLDICLTSALALFLCGLVTGAFTKKSISSYLKYSRVILTNLRGQKMRLKYDERLEDEVDSNTPFELMGNLSDGEYMPDHIPEEWDRLQKEQSKYSNYYDFGYKAQEKFVVLGYVIVVVIGAPLVTIPW